MNKKKVIYFLIPVLIVAFVLFSQNVFGFTNFQSDKLGSVTGNRSGMDAANNAVNRIWGTVTLILQVLAVAAIVIAGVRYMFASADGKADIKKQTIGLVAGAILVFAASSVVKFVVQVANEVTNTK